GKVDLAGALKIPGVRAAIARADQVVRFAGQEVAAVAAITPQLARDALRAITVDYQPLPFVASMQEALTASAPRVFASDSNVSAPKVYQIGNVEHGFSQAAAIHEAVYTTSVQAHVSLETHGAVARWDNDKLTVWVSTQGIFTVRDDLMVF